MSLLFPSYSRFLLVHRNFGHDIHVEAGTAPLGVINTEARKWNNGGLDLPQLAVQDPVGARACLYAGICQLESAAQEATWEAGLVEPKIRVDSKLDGLRAVIGAYEQGTVAMLSGAPLEKDQHIEVYSLLALGGVRQALGVRRLAPYAIFDVPGSPPGQY